MHRNILIIIFTCLVISINGANILYLNGCPSPSHHIWHVSIINELAARGHNVTYVSPDLDKNPPKNVHYIYVDGVYEFMYKDGMNLALLHNESSIDSVVTLNDFGIHACAGMTMSNGLKTLLDYPDNFKFDLILYDFTLGPCILGYLHKFNYPPLVGLTAYNIPSYTVELMGGHYSPAYIPYCSLNYNVDMTLFQRIHNTFIYIVDYLYRNYYLMPALDEMAHKVFGANLPDVRDLEKKMILALVNSHPSVDLPESLGPSVISVGGLQVKDPPNPLAKDIENFINSAEKAAVLFSFGTNVRSDQIGNEKQKALLNAFAAMPEYNFLWKFESDSLPVRPTKNVLIKSFMPQNDILAHPKVKAFISHSGLLSTHEATWHGVPIIGVPFFVDQHRNLRKSVEAGVAVKLPFDEITTKRVIEAVRKVLENPSYQKNMKIRSKKFRDQPEKPLDRAIWWIEFILRNPNPKYLRSPVLDLGFFRSNLYDIILLVFGVIPAVLGILVFVLVKYVKKLLEIIREKSKEKLN